MRAAEICQRARHDTDLVVPEVPGGGGRGATARILRHQAASISRDKKHGATAGDCPDERACGQGHASDSQTGGESAASPQRSEGSVNTQMQKYPRHILHGP